MFVDAHAKAHYAWTTPPYKPPSCEHRRGNTAHAHAPTAEARFERPALNGKLLITFSGGARSRLTTLVQSCINETYTNMCEHTALCCKPKHLFQPNGTTNNKTPALRLFFI